MEGLDATEERLCSSVLAGEARRGMTPTCIPSPLWLLMPHDKVGDVAMDPWLKEVDTGFDAACVAI